MLSSSSLALLRDMKPICSSMVMHCSSLGLEGSGASEGSLRIIPLHFGHSTSNS